MKILILFLTVFPTLVFSQINKRHDIIINEIMFDPSPTVKLANAEFIELYNNSKESINLENWTLSINSKSTTIAKYILKSGEYLTITSTKNEELFFEVNTIYLKISSLNNKGAKLSISSPNGVIIDEVEYSPSWHKNKLKANGGWSLELINPNNDCLTKDNWDSSESNEGGTPGRENSILNPNFYPEIKNNISQIYSNDDFDKLFIELEHHINTSSIDIETNYNGNFKTDAVNNSDGSAIITLHLRRSSLNTKVFFTLLNLENCDGSIIKTDSIWIGEFNDAEMGNVVINEVLFNPIESGGEFVEIFNNTQNFISIKNFSIANYNYRNESSSFENVKLISSKNIFLMPMSYMVLTKNTDYISSTYKSGKLYYFVELPSLPRMNNDEGKLALLDASLNCIDKIAYYNDMHISLMKDEKRKGVSLERIRASNPSLDFENWTSASQSCDGATPALINSASPINNESTNHFKVSPEVFHPRQGTNNTITELLYKMDKPGYIANVKIFNSNGVFIKDIANNYLMSIEGSFIWDGNDFNNGIPSNGIYIFWVEIFDIEGNVKVYKKIVVLS
ncbi:MAG: lamin tail domain-containing protein [Flavobacteriales bacterium]|nr:lamin tail domain-containing protein [Flavobacteriales bacterium]